MRSASPPRPTKTTRCAAAPIFEKESGPLFRAWSASGVEPLPPDPRAAQWRSGRGRPEKQIPAIISKSVRCTSQPQGQHTLHQLRHVLPPLDAREPRTLQQQRPQRTERPPLVSDLQIKRVAHPLIAATPPERPGVECHQQPAHLAGDALHLPVVQTLRRTNAIPPGRSSKTGVPGSGPRREPPGPPTPASRVAHARRPLAGEGHQGGPQAGGQAGRRAAGAAAVVVRYPSCRSLSRASLSLISVFFPCPASRRSLPSLDLCIWRRAFWECPLGVFLWQASRLCKTPSTLQCYPS